MPNVVQCSTIAPPAQLGDARVRIFIADDSQMICARIATLLSDVESLEIIGTACTAADAVKSVSQLHPDMVIMDFHLSRNEGIVTLRSIRKAQPAVRVIVLISYPLMQTSYTKLCLDAWADFCVDKSNDFLKLPEILSSLICNEQTPCITLH